MHFVISNNNNNNNNNHTTPDEERPRVYVNMATEQPISRQNPNRKSSGTLRQGQNVVFQQPPNRQSPHTEQLNPHSHQVNRSRPLAMTSSLSPDQPENTHFLISPSAAAISAAAANVSALTATTTSPQNQQYSTTIPDGRDVRVNGKQHGWSKQEKTYISQLETQLRLHEQRKNELIDKNNSLESLVKIQDEKIQTYLDEIKHLRTSYDSLFKENKQLHMRMDGFAFEKNALLSDNSNLREEIKKAQARLALPFRPALPKKQTNLKSMHEISRENNYVDATLLANDATLARYSSAKSDSQQSLSALQMVSSNTQSPILQSTKKQPQNLLQQPKQSTSQSNLHKKTNSNKPHNNNNPRTISALQQTLEENFRAQLEEQIDRLHEEADSHRYEIRLLNQALARRDSVTTDGNINYGTSANSQQQQQQQQQESQQQKQNGNEQAIIQDLIAQLVESKSRITQHEKATSFLQEKIESFEQLIDSYTQSHKNNPREMDRASLERKNVFLIEENSTLLATINALRLEIQEQSKRIIEATQRPNYESIQSQEYSTIPGAAAATAGNIQPNHQFYQSAQFRNGNNSIDGMKSSTGSLTGSQLAVQKKKISLGESIQSQKLANADMLSTCCKDTKSKQQQKQLLNQKQKRMQSNNNNNNNNSNFMNVSFENLNDAELRKQLQFEKNKNQLLTQMVEEEQEKHCELIVYKEEIDYYVNKNRDLTKEVIHLNKQLNEIHLTHGMKIPASLTVHGTSSPRRASALAGAASSIGSPKANNNMNGSMTSSRNNQRSPRLQSTSPLRCSSAASSSIHNMKSDRVLSVASQKSMGNNVVDMETMRCAHLQLERELNSEIEKKEQQIDNIITSRNILQKTLGDQLQNTQADNKELSEKNRHLENQVTILTHEITALKTLVRRAERKNLLGIDD